MFELPHLGKIHIEQVIMEYDGPLLFSVRTDDGLLHIGFFADKTEKRKRTTARQRLGLT